MMTLTLTEDQQAALSGLLEFCRGELDRDWPAALLEGYAGTGKTTLLGVLVDRLVSQDFTVAVVAPTNKAVGVLVEKVSSATHHATLHSLLGLSPRPEGDRQVFAPSGASRLGDYDVVIVDECSMIGADLLRHIKGRAKIVFVGDPAQLPPVGEDISPVFRSVGLRWTLSKVVRQAEGNAIVDLSLGIRLKSEQELPIDLGYVREFLEGKNEACVMAGVDLPGAVIHEGREGRDCRILAWRNATVDRYNREIFRRLYPNATTPFVTGQTVLVSESFEYDASLHKRLDTSEEVEVVSLSPDERFGLPVFLVTVLRSSGERVAIPIPRDSGAFKAEVDAAFRQWRFFQNQVKCAKTADEASEADRKAQSFQKRGWGLRKGIAELRHPWALTVHKAQGSTYDTVFVDWNDLQGIATADFPRIFYTAVTRPSKFLAICH